MKQLCKGKNCKAIDGINHSDECEDEHDQSANPLDTAGNRNPEARYAGYKGHPFPSRTVDQEKAYQEGVKARDTK